MERVLLPPVRVHHKINSEIQKRAPLKRIGKVLGRAYRPYAASDPRGNPSRGGFWRASSCATYATTTKPRLRSAGSTRMSVVESLLLLYESQTWCTRMLRRRGEWGLSPLRKSFVGNRNNAQGSVHVCRWWKSVTLPPLDQPCDPRNFRSIGFVFRH
jgi:hypothetical protein